MQYTQLHMCTEELHIHLSSDSLCLLRLEKVEQYVHQVGVVIVGVYDIAVYLGNESQYHTHAHAHTLCSQLVAQKSKVQPIDQQQEQIDIHSLSISPLS